MKKKNGCRFQKRKTDKDNEEKKINKNALYYNVNTANFKVNHHHHRITRITCKTKFRTKIIISLKPIWLTKIHLLSNRVRTFSFNFRLINSKWQKK